MDEEDEDGILSPLKTECFKVLLRKLVPTENLQKVAEAFLQKKLISKHQKKKFCFEVKENNLDEAFEKLFAAFEQKKSLTAKSIRIVLGHQVGDSANQSSISSKASEKSPSGDKEDEETSARDSDEGEQMDIDEPAQPGDGEGFPLKELGKLLLSHVVSAEDMDFVNVVVSWNTLTELEHELKPLAMEISSNENWVRTLVYEAFQEVIVKDEKTKIFDRLKEELQKKVNREAEVPESDAKIVREEYQKTGSSQPNDRTRNDSEDTGNGKPAVPDVRSPSGDGHNDAKVCDKHQVLTLTNSMDDVCVDILLPEDLITVPGENEHLLEIRAVVSDIKSLPHGTPLQIMFYENPWHPITMSFNKRKKFYFLRILFNAKHAKNFHYRFCYSSDKIHYEILPGDDIRVINRVEHLSRKQQIALNVCIFKRTSSWTDICCATMKNFLPTIDDISAYKGDTNFLQDIISWIQIGVYGWKTTWYYKYHHTPSDRDWECILVRWLENLNIENKSDHVIFRVLIGLYITMALDLEEKLPQKELFNALVRSMRIEELDKNDCKILYTMATDAQKQSMADGCKMLSFHEAMHRIYKQVSNFRGVEWILTLPLYWLLVNGKVKQTVLDEDEREADILLARSSLPNVNGLAWRTVWRDCQENIGPREAIMDMAAIVMKLEKLHPWIVKTFQFMLKINELTGLIFYEYEVTKYFPIDSVVQQYMNAYSKNLIQNVHCNELELYKKYFQRRLQSECGICKTVPKIPAYKKEADKLICFSILRILNKFFQPYDMPNRTKTLMVIDSILFRTVNWIALLNLGDRAMGEIHAKLVTFLDTVTNTIKNSIITKEIVEYWSKLLGYTWELKKFNERWTDLILMEIKKSINYTCSHSRDKKEFMELYVSDLGGMKLHPDLMKCLSDKAYEIVEKMLGEALNRTGLYRSFRESLPKWTKFSETRPSIIPIMEKLFIKEYTTIDAKSYSGQATALRFLCTWSFSVQFYDLFGEEWLEAFSNDSKDVIKRVQRNFKEIVRLLCDRLISVDYLKIILNHQEKFLMLCGLFNVDNKATSVDEWSPVPVAKAVVQCKHDLQTFESIKESVKNFVSCCYTIFNGNLPSACAALDEKVKMEIKSKPIIELVTLFEDSPGSSGFFEITTDQLLTFQEMSFIKDSPKLFMRMFQEAVDAINDNDQNPGEITMDDILNAWLNTKTRILDFTKELDTGIITIDIICTNLAVLEGDENKMRTEVDLLYKFFKRYDESDPEINLNGCDARKTQIANVFQLKRSKQAMDILLQIKDKIKLQGDFGVFLEQMKPVENQSESHLYDVPEDLKLSSVAKITLEQIDILEKFKEQEEVVDWLQDKMEHSPDSSGFFEITDAQLQTIQEMSFIKKSHKLFLSMFKEAVSEIEDLNPGEKTIEIILDTWKKTKARILDFVKKLDPGKISIDFVCNNLSALEGDEDFLRIEVDLLYEFFKKYDESDPQITLSECEARKAQIANVFQLKHSKRAMDILLQIKEKINLQEDFKIFLQQKKLMENQAESHLYEVPEDLQLSSVVEITSEQIDILEKFMEQQEVISWLQDKMEGINEVKVMCDLAMISASEDAVEVGRVSCLLRSVMGFAPLIFWSESQNKSPQSPEESNGLSELMKCCKIVWNNVKENPHILDDWKETSHRLKWFMDVENFYGSVEKSSLAKAQEINKGGVYRIATKQGEQIFNIKNAITLTLTGDNKKEPNQVLTLDKLTELQSKLMLITGKAEKGQRDVNQFIEVLSSVEKLAEVLVRLQASGCMLFSGWETVIMCNSGDDNVDTKYLAIHVVFTEGAPPLTAQGNHNDLNQITEILEESCIKWENHVSSKRMEHYYLNEYNINQIMYLCRELSNFEVSDRITDQVYTLLSFVRQNFSEEELKESIQNARREVSLRALAAASDNELSHGETTEDEDDQDPDGSIEARKRIAAVRTLVSEDVPENAAKAAVQSVGRDLDCCRVWILENQSDYDLIERLSEDFEEAHYNIAERRNAAVNRAAFERNGNNTLRGVIMRLQRNSMDSEEDGENIHDSIKTICTGYLDETVKMDLQDHHSIELLGQTLMMLSQQSEIIRKKMPLLHCGAPNLLVCTEEDLLATVLSLYMGSPDQPLPSQSEVFICSEETSKDDVERFVRRATCLGHNQGQLLFTLAFADKLNYSNSVAMVEIFNKCMNSRYLNCNYQLVILLSKPQHYLAMYFYKNLVDWKLKKKSDEICKYLAHHLAVADDRNSAAQAVHGHFMITVISSRRSGVGKSLHAQRIREILEVQTDVQSRIVTIRLLENKIDLNHITEKLSPAGRPIRNKDALMAHIDMTPAVQHGIEAFVFNLFILGSIQGRSGKVWRRHKSHLYLFEMTDFGANGEKRFSNHHILNLLPCVKCYSPLEVLQSKKHQLNGEWLPMDPLEFRSETFQRPFQYLRKFENGEDLDQFSYSQPEGDESACIEVLLRHCCITDPSWAQLRHFCSFLNFQLKNCEKSVFCNDPVIKELLTGLKEFAVRFMIKMAQDFATPSLTISDASMKDAKDVEFEAHQLRRKWEESSHPYVFFNQDGDSMTFINVKIDRQGNLLDKNDKTIQHIITPALMTALHQQHFDLGKNFETYTRMEKLGFLCQVLGINQTFDPDPTYELTTDNVLKILAIHTRFQCGIPVIIMGETGCGKTRLVEFMSKLKAEPQRNGADRLENMTTLKIHGGITVKDVHKSAINARVMERTHQQIDDYTILFCDEANTTEAIYAIKEVMCDRSIDGEYFDDSKLHIVAACNPYKKLSQQAIAKLEDSGLGYHIHTSKTAHLFGNIPVRSLVYRVVALPPSMQPFVWDFGQLNDETEMIYIQQMTEKLGVKLNLDHVEKTLLNRVLSHCQQYMRTQTNECRYVSLRDVERCMITFEWFHQKSSIIYPMLLEEMNKKYPRRIKIHKTVRTIILTVGVCYHASLDERVPFRRELAKCLNQKGVDEHRIECEIICCQTAFLKNVQVGKNIACNQALRENTFMMAICADMKIPLFLVGKPGSSKSLAKTIITNNMQGQISYSALYRHLKQIHILSYQCSALTDADGIQNVFNQCLQLQKKQNLNTYTAIVVLDEIGLAEDSPNMPLKILHPLLEHRSTDLATVNKEDSEHVGFIGISNWALDPAKMNRGIFLTRDKPEEKDLRETGKEIFQGNVPLWNNNEDLFAKLTSTYVEMYGSQNVEYFGLRDYYSLMKMICQRCPDSDQTVPFAEVVYAICRNFGGGEDKVIKKFIDDARMLLQHEQNSTVDPIIPIQKMMEDNLSEKGSRFLLLLANQFSIVSLVQSCIENQVTGLQVVFGSSFPGDHSYTEICRNINKIKVCMETGHTVILLNMSKIHESLYDALNQHYVTMGKKNFVDLGLGGHRVKCQISEDFRLIVVEKKEVVMQEYPIPLINRLEKHHFSSENLLGDHDKVQSLKLRRWAEEFNSSQSCFTCNHSFIGYHDDTPSSVIFTSTERILEKYKEKLLQSCAMDAIFRLKNSEHDDGEINWMQKIYFNEQQHDSLADVLRQSLERKDKCVVMEITSFSGVLWKKDKEELEKVLDIPARSITLVPLEQFHTQQEYCIRLDKFFEKCEKYPKSQLILLVQCAQAQENSSLIACARYCLMNKVRESRKILDQSNVTICLLLSTERAGISGDSRSLNLQPTSDNLIIHVDEFRPSNEHISPASKFFMQSLQGIFEDGKQQLERGEEDLESLVNIRKLLTDCISEALTKIKASDQASDERNLERVEILMNLCSYEDDIGKNFRKIVMEKVVQAFSQIGNFCGSSVDWIVEQANDADALQDAGTFRKALWLCLKKHLARFLAFIISHIDRNSNLDVISKPDISPWEIEMWLGMFHGFDIPWPDMITANHFVVAGKGIQNTCSLPFSFVAIDYMESRWKALERPDMDMDYLLFKVFRDFSMSRVFLQALTHQKVTLMKTFTEDVVKNLYQPGTSQKVEIELISKVLFDFTMKKFREICGDREFQDGDEIALIYLIFKFSSRKLETFSEVLKRRPEILEQSQEWLKKQENDESFLLHIYAFEEVLGILKKMAENITDPKICEQWIDLAREVKKLYSFVINDVEQDNLVRKINHEWQPLQRLDLLLLHLLPPQDADNDFLQKFIKTVAPQAKLFWRGTASSDPHSERFLKIVLNVLKKCTMDINMQLLLGWKDSKCKICKKIVKRPTFLPCGHFGCEDCISRRLEETRKCPLCNKDLPQNFHPTPRRLDDNRTKILEQTKLNCNSFFLEFLQQFCFNSSAERNITERMETFVQKIIRNLVLEEESTPLDLDPTGLDLNINFKSCLLQSLLNHNQNLVEGEIGNFLRRADNEMLEPLINVIMKVFLSKIKSKTVNIEKNLAKLTRYWSQILQKSLPYLQQHRNEITMKTIEETMNFRCVLCHFALVLNMVRNKEKIPTQTYEQIQNFIFMVINAVRDAPDVVKEFLLKFGTKMYGSQWQSHLIERDELKVLIPPYLRQALEDHSSDIWVLFGQEFTETKALLYQNDPKDYKNTIATIFTRNVNPILAAIAVISWLSSNNDQVFREGNAALQQSCPNLVEFLRLTSGGNLQDCVIGNTQTEQEAITIYQLIVPIIAVVTTSQNSLFLGFRELLRNPHLLQHLFLPTMPEHLFFSVPTDFRVQSGANSMYTCPKGHLYSIGNCTQPVMMGRCPQCKENIGGVGYQAAAGNQKFMMDEKSQAGYQRVNNTEGYSTGKERMSVQGHSATQMILHSVLLASSFANPGIIAGAMRFQNDNEARAFLVHQLQRNLQDLSTSLAKNVDEAAYIMIRMMMRFLQDAPRNHPENWVSLQNRKDWEVKFRTAYLKPIFQNMDNELAAAQAAIQEGEEVSGAVLARLQLDLPKDEGNNLDWQKPILWTLIEHRDSNHLMQALQDAKDETTGKVLQLILKAQNLQFVKHLENILRLQQRLVERYQYKLDLRTADDRTLGNHIERESVDDEEGIKQYIRAWNQLFPKLKAVAPDFLKEYFNPLSRDSPLSMALPSMRGRGQCAKLIAEFLIETQNDFLNECMSVIKPHQTLKEVDVQQMTGADFVCISKEKDLMAMINMHTRYNIHTSREQGRQHRITYNFEALEKQVRDRYVLCKKLIKKNSLLCMKYLQDVGIGDDWIKVESTIKPEPLTVKLCQDIDVAVRKSHSSDVFDSVRTLTNAISFLAMVKGDPTKPLHEFLEKDLRIPSTRSTIIPREIQLRHILSLYERLSWHKAIYFVNRGLDPYKEALRSIPQERIPDDIVIKLKEAFQQTKVQKLQQMVNRMLITRIGTGRADWSLAEDVFPNLDEDDDNSWYARLPVEICNKHIAHLFAETVHFKANSD